MRSTIPAALALALLTTAAAASDDKPCTAAPRDQWQTIEKLAAKLTEQGWQVNEIEFEDGCAEAEVVGKDGRKAELKLDPATAALVKTEEDD